jgi:RNA polymerase sigma factor (sigma-70 family)
MGRETERLGIAETGPEAVGGRLAELFASHGRMVYGLCVLLLRDSHEAEDAAQQAFLSAYESLRSGVTPLRPEAWLAAIARNECLDRLRKRTREPVQPLDREPAAPGTEEIVARHADFAAVRSALAELPERQREALLLHELCGLSYLEIAQILGVSQAAVESLLFRGRRQLHDRAAELRLFSGIIILPLGLGEGLARAVPGFSTSRAVEAGVHSATGAGACGSAGGGTMVSGGGGFTALVSAKVASLPIAAKVAATAALLVGTTSVVAGEGVLGGRAPLAETARVATAQVAATATVASLAGAGGTKPVLPAVAASAEPARTDPVASGDGTDSGARGGPASAGRPDGGWGPTLGGSDTSPVQAGGSGTPPVTEPDDDGGAPTEPTVPNETPGETDPVTGGSHDGSDEGSGGTSPVEGHPGSGGGSAGDGGRPADGDDPGGGGDSGGDDHGGDAGSGGDPGRGGDSGGDSGGDPGGDSGGDGDPDGDSGGDSGGGDGDGGGADDCDHDDHHGGGGGGHGHDGDHGGHGNGDDHDDSDGHHGGGHDDHDHHGHGHGHDGEDD